MTELTVSPEAWRERVALRRSNRARSIRLKIHPTGRVELVVPRGFDERRVPAILDQHETWVLRHLKKVGGGTGLDPVTAPRRILLPATGGEWEVDYLSDDGGRYGCRVHREGRLRVSGGLHWQQCLKRWLARQGRQHLAPWLAQVSEETGLSYSGVSIRCQRTRWGSCSSRQHINLNYGLLFLPPELVRYLFIHELCHTRHMNHSARYWRLVAKMEPEYSVYDRALRQAGRHLPPWLHATEIMAV